MSLRKQLEQNGSWLFRHRSYLPLVVVPVFVLSLPSFKYLFASHKVNEAWQMVCLAVSFLGLAVRIMTVGRAPRGTSGRNTREQVAASLTTTGTYSLVRHPLYLGNFLVFFGIILWPHNWALAALSCCVFALYYERIMLAEEAFLREKFGDDFESWAAATPAFIPRFSKWKRSPVSFCWRTVLQREYNAFILIAGAFFLFDFVGDSLADGRWHISYGWFLFFLVAFIIFAALRTLKKRTKLLHVASR